ncbi:MULTISPECIES: hemolysin family protein [Prauserella salsuginis group]|uniref:CBS domain containing-hemolysin-like protein n=2 Tax=Prauserella salsuginis group TaxID=2893672 RepID=A0A839XLM1_9PSEU|nr:MULTISPECIES: hemolysin family protein [Prauserella salsuginis group]MBB3664792.1 CBS domain containing-hemolysin-like protein [Prauserella sediminis]MCR3718261.1 Hemolysin, contains CBS domains [Prauserella flava]MCR3732831.1 Hemolysin, contains CBS domains [Prauserella salsuginis]
MDVLLTIGGLLVVVLLTVGTGLAVAAEFSLTTLERSTIEANVRQVGDRRSKTVLKAHRTLSFQLSGAQVAITLTTLLTGYVAEPLLGKVLRPALTGLGLPDSGARGASLVLSMLLATVLSMVIGEMVPKNLAVSLPLKTARAVAGYHSRFSALFRWLITLMNNSANVVVRKLGIEPQEELRSARSPQELGSIVRTSAASGTLDVATAQLLDRSLRFGERTAAELMTPRVRVQSLHVDDAVADLVDLSRSTGLSRFPVYREDLDDVQGAVHIKQAFTVRADERRTVPIGSVMRPVPTVPESLPGDALLDRLRASRFQLAIVVDEYGGSAGLVTLEDVVEEIIGDVRDEHDDREEPASQQIGADSWAVSGQLRGDEVADITGFAMPDGDYETIAGLILERLGRIPDAGDAVDIDGWRLTVTEMDRHRIAEVRVERREVPA